MAVPPLETGEGNGRRVLCHGAPGAGHIGSARKRSYVSRPDLMPADGSVALRDAIPPGGVERLVMVGGRGTLAKLRLETG